MKQNSSPRWSWPPRSPRRRPDSSVSTAGKAVLHVAPDVYGEPELYCVQVPRAQAPNTSVHVQDTSMDIHFRRKKSSIATGAHGVRGTPTTYGPTRHRRANPRENWRERRQRCALGTGTRTDRLLRRVASFTAGTATDANRTTNSEAIQTLKRNSTR